MTTPISLFWKQALPVVIVTSFIVSLDWVQLTHFIWLKQETLLAHSGHHVPGGITMLAPFSDQALTKMLKIQQLAGFYSDWKDRCWNAHLWNRRRYCAVWEERRNSRQVWCNSQQARRHGAVHENWKGPGASPRVLVFVPGLLCLYFIVCSSQYLSQDLHKLIDSYILACSLFYCERMVWLCFCVSVLLACMWCALLFALKVAFERYTRVTEWQSVHTECDSKFAMCLHCNALVCWHNRHA
jgi:hypothetical protein